MHYELRPKTQVLKTGTLIKAWHCIEIRQGKKWTLLGDDNGLHKFATAEERDAKLADLRVEIAQANDPSSATADAGRELQPRREPPFAEARG
jgi:hypothetical protein